ncbi:hypothetical protein BH23GEM7_BH23GEM7_06060 [soil metagenome]
MKCLFRKLLLALPLPALLLALGCAEMPAGVAPEAAADAPLFNNGQGNPDLGKLAKFNTKPSITIAWAKKWIGPEGGRLDFQGFAIEVPAGAVGRTTQFSIRLPVDPHGSERVMAEFGPHGATFAQPVFIELPLAGTSIENSATHFIVWWSNDWMDMGGSITDDGQRLRTTTSHFSSYGTTDQRGVVITSGG